MNAKVFISYSRHNQYIAERLHLDLERAGCQVWWDQRSIPLGDKWMKRIEEGIAECDHFLYLWSPEARDSEYVRRERELFEQRGKAVKIVRIAGNTDNMEDGLNEHQVFNLSQDYWRNLPQLLAELGVPKPVWQDLPSPKQLIQQQVKAFEAREQLRDLSPREWTVVPARDEADARLRKFIRVPLVPKAYATSWWIAEENEKLSGQGKFYVALDFSGDRNDNIVQDVLSFLCAEPGSPWPQLLHLEGPTNSNERAGQDRPIYRLPNDKPDVWRDCVDLAVSVIKDFGNKREAHFFMDAPQALVFPIAAKLREFTSYHIYNLARASSSQRYWCVYSHHQ